MRFLTWLSRRRFPYEPLITVEISKGRLLRNLERFRRLAPRAAMAPVLKSNAYGHGLCEVAAILELNNHIPFFVVDSYFEAVALRARHFHTPLLVIGYTRPETIAAARLKNVSFTITNLDTLRRLSQAEPPCPEAFNLNGGSTIKRCHLPRSRRVRLHLKVDTGMRRQGLLPEELDEALAIISGNNRLVLEGMATHFADAANTDGSFTEGQISLWNRLVKQIRQNHPTVKYFHAAATDAAALSGDIDANVVRLGLGLYGLNDHDRLNRQLGLEPVLEMKTIVTGTKELKEGETVGYANTFRADKNLKIATIPVGYFEGIDRRLSNKGSVQVGPRHAPCPIIGRISMNITTIDVSKANGIDVGESVIVFSREATDQNSIQNLARRCGTISYELVVKIPAHLKRVVVE